MKNLLFYCVFLLSGTTFASENRFSCKFSLALAQDEVIERKSHAKSLAKRSFLGKGAAAIEERDSIFLDELRKLLFNGPHITSEAITGGAKSEEFIQTIRDFKSWFGSIKQVFVAELVRQHRSPDEIRAYTDAFVEYAKRADEFFEPEFVNQFSVINSRQRYDEITSQLLSLRHHVAEVVYASTRSDIVCISCPAKQFLARVLHTEVGDPQFERMLREIMPANETSFLAGEIDLATMRNGQLHVVEFKFNTPASKKERNEHGNLLNGKAQRMAYQLLRTSRLMSWLNRKASLLPQYGLSLSLSQMPELTLAPVVPYRINPDLRTFIKTELQRDPPNDVEFKNRPVLNDAEMEDVFAQILGEAHELQPTF